MWRNRWRNNLLFMAAISLAAMMPGNAIADAASDDAKKARICEKAEKRYQKLFAKLPSEEDAIIVMMHKYTFCPSNITINRGETIRWVNVDKRTSHSVWFKQLGTDESQRLFGEEQVEMTFDGPAGEFQYLCGPHWKEEGMVGKVTVKP